MKKLNNKGFAVSTLIYGILVLFIVVISILISTLSFRYRSLSDITTRAEDKKSEYFLNVGIYLEENEEYTTPHSATYNFEYNVGEETKICSVHLENNKTIKYDNNEYKLYIDETEIDNCDFTNNESIYLKNIKTTERLIEDRSGANIPDLRNGLVPVKYIKDVDNKWKWVVTSPDDPDWYNYDKQEWANAVSLDLSTIEKKERLLSLDGKPKVDVELNLPTESSTDSDVLAMFVWIPRFSYTIGCHEKDKCYGYRLNDNPDTDPGVPNQELPGAIDIKFVAKDKKDELKYKDEEKEKPIYPTYEYSVDSSGMPMADRDPQNWYTHPAFTFGDEELSGIWIGKFETSTDKDSVCYTTPSNSNCSNTSQSPRILPNVISLRYQTVYNQFYTAQKFTATDNIYGLIGDAHMMKNSEWAAVAYLSQSIYGKYGNPIYTGKNKEVYKNDSTDYYTGRSSGKTPSGGSQVNIEYNNIVDRGDGKGASGAGASTTGNIYGIYDMVGGAREYVMLNFNGLPGNSGFEQIWFNVSNNKYIQIVNENILVSNINEITVGQATSETFEWYSDDKSSLELQNDYSWLVRSGVNTSGINAGLFYMWSQNGDSMDSLGKDGRQSFRVTLVY